MKSLITIGLFFIALSGYAQQKYADTTLQHLNLQEVVITAQYVPLAPQASVYKINTIGQESINHSGATNLRELLYHQMNIDLEQKSVFGTSMEIQGMSKENVKFLIDGVPMIGRLNGVIDLNQINLDNIERVEIIEGPTSVFYGSDAIAGTINLITKKNTENGVTGGISGYMESVGHFDVDGRIGLSKGSSSAQISGGADFFNGYSEVDTLRGSDWENRNQYFANADYNLSVKDLIWYVNGRYFREALDKKGEPDGDAMAEDIEYVTNRWSAETGLKGEFGNHNYMNLAFSYLDYNRRSNTYTRDVNNGGGVLTDNPSDHDTTKFKTWFVKYQYSRNNPDKKVSYAAGTELNLENTEGRRILDKKQSIQDYAFFGSIKYEPTAWFTIQPGLRWSINSRYKAPLSPALNLKFDPGKNAHIRLSYAMGYRAPSLKELYLDFSIAAGPFTYTITGNEDLRAERSHSINLSYDQQIAIGKNQSLTLETDLFYNKMRNLIALSEIENFARHYININEFQTHGGKFSIDYKPVPEFAVRAGVSVTGRQNEYAEEHDVRSNLYSVNFVGSTHYTCTNRHFSAGLNYKFYGPRQGFIVHRSGDIEETTIDGAHLLDLNISKSYSNDLMRFDLGVKNLIGITSYDTLGTQSGEAHSRGLFFWGRSFYVKMKVRMAKGLVQKH
ncbi:MAG: TonB-dependent receptor [Bacteroidetes bacterium]|nr:TonB-dependent receptor [Bacteroidota bacterium]